MKLSYFILLLALTGLLMNCSESDTIIVDTYSDDLDKMIQSTSSIMNQIYANIQTEVKLAEQNFPDSALIRRKLQSFLQNNTKVEEFNFLDSTGILKYMEPQKYYSFQGYDLSKDDSVMKMMRTLKGYVFKVIKVFEGYNASIMALPIVRNGRFAGAYDCLLKPDVILREIIAPVENVKKIDVWVMEKGGLQLYDKDDIELYKNFFTDSMYQKFPEALKVVRIIDSQDAGNASYEYNDWYTGKPVKKVCFWKTYNYFGIPWRFVCAKVIE